jgi:hypothetical protein
LTVTDTAGKEHDLTNAEGIRVEVVKRGPLYVVIRYSGAIVVDGSYRASFSMTAEMPNGPNFFRKRVHQRIGTFFGVAPDPVR